MPAHHKIHTRVRTDWFRILADLQYAGWPNSRASESIGVADNTLRGWKYGSEPAHCDGERLLCLWHSVTNRPVSDRPMTTE